MKLSSLVVSGAGLVINTPRVRLPAAVYPGSNPGKLFPHDKPTPMKLQPFGAKEIWLI